jgi:hypothetical protein
VDENHPDQISACILFERPNLTKDESQANQAGSGASRQSRRGMNPTKLPDFRV